MTDVEAKQACEVVTTGDLYDTRQYWIKGSEVTLRQDLDTVAQEIAKLLKETENVLGIEADIRYGIRMTVIMPRESHDG